MVQAGRDSQARLEGVICATVALLLAVALSVEATRVRARSLPELVDDADHVLIGKIVRVSIVDGDGRELASGSTGPGRENEMRLHVEVTRVLRTPGEAPEALVIPLYKNFHYSLQNWKQEEGERYIFLLRGYDFQRVYPGLFRRPLSEEAEIMELIAEIKGP